MRQPGCQVSPRRSRLRHLAWHRASVGGDRRRASALTRALGAGLLLCLLVSCHSRAGAPSATSTGSAPSPGGWEAPSRFVSLRLKGLGASGDGIWVSDAESGATTRQLAFTNRQGLAANGTFLDRLGRLWVSYSHGPDCTSGVAGCGP